MLNKTNRILPANSYLNRYFQYSFKNRFRQTIDDFSYFPVKEIYNSKSVYRFSEEKKPELFQSISYFDKSGIKESDFSSFMEGSNTTAFIVIKDDKILYENYFNGYNRESISRIFSATKSFMSALIGIATGEGLIDSIHDQIKKYLPDIKDEATGKLTIENLLLMQSGISYKEGIFPWTDDSKQYFSADTRKLALNLKVTDPVGEFFHYNDYHLQILTMILERVTNKSAGRYLEEKIWKPLDMEYPALLVADSPKCGFEKMDSGICARAIDLAKFGRLYLNKGQWEGKEVVPESWVKASTSCENVNDSKEYFRYYHNKPWGRWFNSGKAYYKYLWWGYKTEEEWNDFFAMGVLGQFIYVSPRKNTVVVRLGKEWGVSGWWPAIIKGIVDKV